MTDAHEIQGWARSGARAAALAVMICAAFSFGPTPTAWAQLGFTEFALSDSTLNSSPVTDFWIASAAPADVDADGDLDLLIAGYYVVYFQSVEERLTLYRNDGPVGDVWSLTPIPLDVTDLAFGAADLAWGDYDNDGDPDVVVGSSGATTLYRNDEGTLVRTGTELPSYLEDSDFSTLDLHSITWADWDMDGDLDLLLPSTVADFSYNPTLILRNDGPGAGDSWTFTDVQAALPPVPNAVSFWADREADGDLDLLLAYVSPAETNFLEIYTNDGTGALTLADSDLAHIRYGMADWGDIDQDGDPDIVYGGNMDRPDGMGETLVRLLRNDGPGTYVPIDIVHEFESPEEPWLDFTAVSLADYDSDGDSDLLISGEWLGEGEIFGRSLVYGNTGGTFARASEALPAPIMGNAGGAFTWFDVDSDGDLDYFVAGGYYVPGGNGLVEARTQLFRNDAPPGNFAPTVPGNPVAIAGGPGAVELRWNPSSDDHTPPTGLTYELEVFPGLGLSDARPRPEPGNVSGNTTWALRDLPPGTYSWQVRALDTAFNGSPAARGSFVIGSSTSVDPAESPSRFSLTQAVPNPARGAVQFSLANDREQRVNVAIHDAMGRRVRILHDGPLAAGTHSFGLDLRDLPSGIYFIQATGSAEAVTRRITLVR